MSDWKTVQYETEGRIARVTLNRPGRLNALDPEMLEELLDLLGRIRAERELSVVVLTGAGRAFSAGVDVRTPFFMENVESDSVFEGKRLLDRQHEAIAAIHELPQVTIAAVNGDAVGGGGFGLAMACDMRFAVRGARFWMVPLGLGVVQDFGLTWFLQRAIGQPRTLELVFSGRAVDADEAAAIGLVNRAVGSAEELRRVVGELAAQIAKGSPEAVRMLKFVVRHGAGSELRMQLGHEAVANGLCFLSTEFREAKAAYLDRMRRKS